jgi:plastocyanin
MFSSRALSALAFTLVTCLAVGPAGVWARPAAQSPREVKVLVGAGQDTVSIDAYLPHSTRVHAGDTVTWTLNGDEPHTVTFSQGETFDGPTRPDPYSAPGELMPVPAMNVPGPSGAPISVLNPVGLFATRAADAPVEIYSGSGYASSGRLTKESLVPTAPPNHTFSLTFDTPGVYEYRCLIHSDAMSGLIDVAPASAVDVPTQADIDGMAEQEQALLMNRLERARAQGTTPRSQPGPNGTSTWFVRAGNGLFQIDDAHISLLQFLPKEQTVHAGDTVIWSSSTAHTVTFNPTPPEPQWLTPEIQADGSVRVVRSAQLLGLANPSGTFEPTLFFNSGVLNVAGPLGMTWSLTFDKAGTFAYYCGVHREQGMKGTIIVLPR